MEEKLLNILKLADLLNEKQNKVFAQIEYRADNSKKLEISIISKETFSYIETFRIDLTNSSSLKWDAVTNAFNAYIGGALNE